MLQELQGKMVKIHLDVMREWTDCIKGEVVEIKNSWVKVQTKKTVELINLDTAKRITVLS